MMRDEGPSTAGKGLVAAADLTSPHRLTGGQHDASNEFSGGRHNDPLQRLELWVLNRC